MNKVRKQFGFSLTEVLIATGIMAIGLVMVATIFPVGVKLTTLTTERTTGAIVADEAFAKIQLYGLRDFQYWPVVDPNIACSDYQYITDYAGPDTFWGTGDETIDSPGEDDTYGTVDDIHFTQYPSTDVPVGQNRNYHWSALCRRVGAKDVQVMVFVSRKIVAALQYRAWDPITPMPITNSSWPKPVKIEVNYNLANLKELAPNFTDPINAAWGALVPADTERVLSFLDDGYTVVDDYSGNIYRVLEVDRTNKVIILQQDWIVDPSKPAGLQDAVWIVPPAMDSNRYPCVGVYQKVLRFDDIN